MSSTNRALWVLSLLIALLWPQLRLAPEQASARGDTQEWSRADGFDPAHVADLSLRKNKTPGLDSASAERHSDEIDLPSAKLIAPARIDHACGDAPLDAIRLRPGFFASSAAIRGPPARAFA